MHRKINGMILWGKNTIFLKNNHYLFIRLLSLHDNKYLRYFKGHRDRYVNHKKNILNKKRVVSIGMNPINDTFLSGLKNLSNFIYFFFSFFG